MLQSFLKVSAENGNRPTHNNQINWAQEKVILGAFLSFVIMSSFLAAYVLQETYGGAMKYSNGSENFLFGVNFGFAASSLIAILLTISIILEYLRFKNA